MANFQAFLKDNELTIVVVLMVLIFILVMAIVVIDLLAKRKEKLETADYENDDRDYRITNMEDTGELGMVANQKILEEIDVDKVTKNLEKTAEIEEIKYVEENEEEEKTKALIELNNLKEELAKMESQKIEDDNKEVEPVVIEEKNNDVKEAINNPIPSVNIKPEEPELIELQDQLSMEDNINRFENEQEEKAIISVEELTNARNNITDEEIEQYEDDGNEPISLKELEALYKSSEIQEELPKEKESSWQEFKLNSKPINEAYEDKSFKTTPVISPVYGLTPNESSIALEQTANLDKLNEEIKKTNEFLNALKELRKNLD